MKKIFFTILCSILSVINVYGEDVKLDSFTNIQVNVPSKLIIKRGNNYSIDVESENPILKKLVKYSVSGDTLTIKTIDMNDFIDNNVDIIITTPSYLPIIKTSRDLLLAETTFNENDKV